MVSALKGLSALWVKMLPSEMSVFPVPHSATAAGELEQIQFLLGHVSVQTTERYLGCKQRLRDAVNDHIGLEPDES